MPEMIIIAGYLTALAIGCVIADHILPHVDCFIDLVDGLPMMSGEYKANNIRKEQAA